MARVAFIGMGIMGLPMAGHLLSAGHTVTVSSRTKAKAKAILDRGAKWADTPAEAAKDAEVVFTCVTDTPDVEAVLLGKGGVVESVGGSTQSGLIVVDHSTISPGATRKMAADLATHGITLLDAPVSGGDLGAKNATLSIMVGGDASAFEKVRPLLGHMGKTITYTGVVGNGQMTKLVNQVLVVGTTLAVCEALTVARRAGLDEKKTIDAVAGGAAGSWQLSNLGPKMVAGDFKPGFMIKLQNKDLRLVAEAVNELGLKLPGLEHVTGLFEQLGKAGRGDEGTQALFEAVGENA